MSKSVDPGETAIWIYTICKGICFGRPSRKG